MLEESRMDKKSLNRLPPPQSRASASDCKKSTGKCLKVKTKLCFFSLRSLDVSYLTFLCVPKFCDYILNYYIDLTHKPWPRNNKKREGSGAAPKNEPYRRNVPPQKGRNQIDKRSRTREPTFNVGGTQNAG